MAEISAKEYRRLAEHEWKGKRVRSIVPIATGMMEMPAGSLFEITGKYSGFSVQSDPCAHCGVALKARRVPHWMLEVVDD